MNAASRDSIIFFDGVCNLCNGFVQFIIRHDAKAKFKFASLQSDSAKKILQEYHIPLDELKTLVLLEHGNVYLRSRAVLRIGKQLDGLWKLSVLFYIVPSFLADAVYNLISKYRYKVFGKRDTCMVPANDLRNRFLE
jgi:predicted DCC family thiol-disulfide oxidoreductase YuxK